MASVAPARTKSLTFWQKITIGIALFDVFAFVQFTARGFVDVATVPPWIHLHAIVMLAWLGLFVLQPMLIRNGDVARHRQVGAVALMLAAGVALLGGYSAVMSVRTGHVPSFFIPSYFLTLTFINLAAFCLIVAAAVRAVNSDRVSHPRLIIAANVLILEPALGRVLPFPLIQPWGEFTVMLVQLGVLAIVARHDIAQFGRVHRSTLAGMATVALTHTLIEMLGRLPAIANLAHSIAQG